MMDNLKMLGKLTKNGQTIKITYLNYHPLSKKKIGERDNKEGNCPQNNNKPKVTQERLGGKMKIRLEKRSIFVKGRQFFIRWVTFRYLLKGRVGVLVDSESD
jgi:hypothetical protein